MKEGFEALIGCFFAASMCSLAEKGSYIVDNGRLWCQIVEYIVIVKP